MAAWDSGWPLGPKLCMERRLPTRDVLRILTSDFDKGKEKHTLGIKERFCVSGMSVVIMRAEHSWSRDLSHGQFS